MATYFASDTHFGRSRIIEYASRPFTSVEEMDEQMIAHWNARIRPRDIIYHLGDFDIGRPERIQKVFSRLADKKYLMVKNHDRIVEMTALGWASVQQCLQRSVDGVIFIMFHYP